MRTPTKFSAYGLALAVIAGGAWVVGTAVGPLGTSQADGDSHAMSGPEAGADEMAGLPGLAVTANGYQFDLDREVVTAGVAEPFRFRILGPDDAPVTRFDVEQDKRLHLVLVRRDTSGYQHLHPQMAVDGTWSVPLTLPAAGTYRLFADFMPTGGTATTLGADVQVSGQYHPQPYESPQRTTTVDGYEVRLDGDLVAGQESPVAVTVTRVGAPVTDLQPYLGAYGHLVALRAADLGYLHVHPLGRPGDGATSAGPEVRFAVEVPTAGKYRLFLDFQHDGRVRTAEFTVQTRSGS